MQIATIEAIPLAVPFSSRSDLPAWRGRDYGALESLLIRIETSDGIVGWGEAFSYNCQEPVRAAVEHMIAPMLIGRDSRQIAPLMHEVQKVLHIYGRYGILNYALSGIDIALWDIAGKRAGRPLGELLGGTWRKEVDAYASLFRFGEPDRVAQAALDAVAQGYRRVKVHTRGDADVAAARAAIGPDIPLMVDTNCAWSIAEAHQALPRLRDFNLMFLEEPIFPPENFVALAALRQQYGIPLALGENACTAFEMQKIITSGAASYLQPSVIKVGGVTEFRKAIALAEVGNVILAPHSPYYGPGLLATLHLIAAQPEPCFIEYFGIGLEGRPYGDRSVPHQGSIALPEGPGLGMDPDADFIRSFSVGRRH